MSYKSRTNYTIAILFVFALVSGCSSRVAYEQHASADSIQNAININTATADELDRLPHVGRKTAEKVIQFREQNGPFRRVEHIMQIRGISEKRFAEIRQYIKTE
jgi:competence ComEA-like helix-hairpin-helix protein